MYLLQRNIQDSTCHASFHLDNLISHLHLKINKSLRRVFWSFYDANRCTHDTTQSHVMHNYPLTAIPTPPNQIPPSLTHGPPVARVTSSCLSITIGQSSGTLQWPLGAKCDTVRRVLIQNIYTNATRYRYKCKSRETERVISWTNSSITIHTTYQ